MCEQGNGTIGRLLSEAEHRERARKRKREREGEKGKRRYLLLQLDCRVDGSAAGAPATDRRPRGSRRVTRRRTEMRDEGPVASTLRKTEPTTVPPKLQILRALRSGTLQLTTWSSLPLRVNEAFPFFFLSLCLGVIVIIFFLLYITIYQLLFFYLLLKSQAFG